MPFTKSPRVARTLGRLAAMTAFGVLASSGVAAAASCPAPSTTTPFSQFGDNNNYFLVQGGSFEGSSLPAGWTASAASLTAGNEPFHANSSSDSQSLTVAPGGSVTTAYQCMDSTMPSMRFFAQQPGANANLKVNLLMQLANGSTTTVPLGVISGSTMPVWGPTPSLSAPAGLAIPVGTTVQAALQFTVTGSGPFQIDDIYVDPYSFG